MISTFFWIVIFPSLFVIVLAAALAAIIGST